MAMYDKPARQCADRSVDRRQVSQSPPTARRFDVDLIRRQRTPIAAVASASVEDAKAAIGRRRPIAFARMGRERSRASAPRFSAARPSS